MTVAKHRIMAICTSPRRLPAQLRNLDDLGACTNDQSVKCVDPGPSGFDFSEDEAKHVLQCQSLPRPHSVRYRTDLADFPGPMGPLDGYPLRCLADMGILQVDGLGAALRRGHFIPRRR
jgi:hypothetical protein